MLTIIVLGGFFLSSRPKTHPNLMTHFNLTQQHKKKFNQWIDSLFGIIDSRQLVSFFIVACIIITLYSIFNSLFIGLSTTIISYATAFFIIFLSLAFMWHFKRYDQLVKTLLVIAVIVGVNIIWFTNGGSSGPTLITYIAFIPIIIFLFDVKMRFIVLTIAFVNILALFFLEYHYPQLITPYDSPKQQMIDVYSNFILFTVLELPILYMARRYFMDRIDLAKKSEQMKTKFLSNMSHEIRTPMNAIIGFTELLYDKSLPKETQESYLNIIHENGYSLLSLISNIMEASQLESGLVSIKESHIVLNDFLFEIHNDLSKLIPTHKKISFQYNVPDELNQYTFKTDRELLYKILFNLISNAIKFTKEGHIELGVKPIDKDKAEIQFYVSDTGIGISKEYQTSIFEKFFQGDFDINGKKDGVGLGLSISHELTKQLGGRMELHSKTNNGSIFLVIFSLK